MVPTIEPRLHWSVRGPNGLGGAGTWSSLPGGRSGRSSIAQPKISDALAPPVFASCESVDLTITSTQQSRPHFPAGQGVAAGPFDGTPYVRSATDFSITIGFPVQQLQIPATGSRSL